MATKKRKTTKRPTKARAKSKAAPKHSLPSGFWQQVLALILFAVSVLLIVSWFGVGGPMLEWGKNAIESTVGFTMYVLPAVFVYVGVKIFQAEGSRLPFVVRLASFLLIVWLAGLFDAVDRAGAVGGGFVGAVLNDGALQLVNVPVAAFIYILLIFVTVVFALGTTPVAVLRKVKEALSTDTREEEQNVRIMKKASEKATEVKGEVEKDKISESDFKVNTAGPVMDDTEANEGIKKPRLKDILPGKTAEPHQEQSALMAVSDPNWKAPTLDLLEKDQRPPDAGDVQHNAQTIKDTLGEFNIDVDMEGANIGPKVTQYTLKPPSGVKLTKITALETNIALNLAAQSLRIEAPIPGQKAVGIEVPNRKAADVRLHGVLTSKQWKQSNSPLSFAIGQDISGEAVVGALDKMPHLLIAGQTGSGKSVMINTLLCSLLYRNSPSDMKLILVDPKQVEMAPYEDIPHLLTPVITDPEKTISALKWAVNEMERRYKLLADEKVREISSYNKKLRKSGKKIAITDEEGISQEHEDGAMPYIVIVIDELSDLMMTAPRDVEALIVRLAQKARAVGIHLVLATQRPSVNVITGLIKANVPARIAFTVASQVDSRTILDQVGAEKLLGQGDMLMNTASMSKPVRVQGALVIDEEVGKITDHLRMQSAPQYNDEIISQPVQLGKNGNGGVAMDVSSGSSADDSYKEALKVAVDSGKISASLLQRRLGIGYAKAARYIDMMEDQGIIGEKTGNSKPRDVLISSIDDLDDSGE